MDEKGKSKRTCFLCEELIKTETPDVTRGKLHERVKLFSMKRNIGDFHEDYYIELIEKISLPPQLLQNTRKTSCC